MFGAADFYVLRDTAPEGCVSTPEFKPGIFGLLDKCANHYTVKCYPAVTPITLKADKFYQHLLTVIHFSHLML